MLSGPFKKVVLCILCTTVWMFLCLFARVIRARVSSDEIALAVPRVGRGPEALCAVAAGAVSTVSAHDSGL